MPERDLAPYADPGAAPPNHARLISREPVLTANLLAALVLEVCSLLRAFGIPLTDAQQNAINGVTAVLVTIGAALIARRFTTSLVDPRDNAGQSFIAAQRQPSGGEPPHGGTPTAG